MLPTAAMLRFGRRGCMCGIGYIAGLPVCRSAGLPVCRSAGLPVCRSAGLPVCRSAGLPVCRSAGEVHASRELKLAYEPPWKSDRIYGVGVAPVRGTQAVRISECCRGSVTRRTRWQVVVEQQSTMRNVTIKTHPCQILNCISIVQRALRSRERRAASRIQTGPDDKRTAHLRERDGPLCVGRTRVLIRSGGTGYPRSCWNTVGYRRHARMRATGRSQQDDHISFWP